MLSLVRGRGFQPQFTGTHNLVQIRPPAPLDPHTHFQNDERQRSKYDACMLYTEKSPLRRKKERKVSRQLGLPCAFLCCAQLKFYCSWEGNRPMDFEGDKGPPHE